MKNNRNSHLCWMLGLFVGLGIGCKGPDTALKSSWGQPKNNPNVVLADQNQAAAETLGNMLRKVPGVMVSGSGFNSQVKIRSTNSFLLTNEPLFIVGGVPVGHSFSQVAQYVNPRDVSHIEVLKGSDATLYGSRGANGVVLISLRGTKP